MSRASMLERLYISDVGETIINQKTLEYKVIE
jgi:hypothetical protein